MGSMNAFLLAFALTAGCSGSAGSTTPPAPERFSHDDWSSVLAAFVDERGLVDYPALARDRAIFDQYIRSVEATGPKSSPELFPSERERLAYYLNAFNAQVFNGVLNKGPERPSVLRGLIPHLGFFWAMRFTVDGERMNLVRLEDTVIREARHQAWGPGVSSRDPRVHAALTWAAMGSPRVAREAFDPERLDHQLDAAMTAFVNDDRHCAVDPASRTVTLSRLFKWFAADFLDHERRQGNADPEVLDYINRYREADRQIPRDYRVRFFAFDRAINRQ